MKLQYNSLVCFIFALTIFSPPSFVNANIYLTGNEGGGMYVYVGSGSQFDSKQESVKHGIVTDYDKTINAYVSGTYGSANSSAKLDYNVNADGLGHIYDDAIGDIAIYMSGSVKRGYYNSWAGSIDDLTVNFLIGGYYEYEIVSDFSGYFTNYYANGKISLDGTDYDEKLFEALSDTNHTVTGSPTGILSPGSYSFSTSMLLFVSTTSAGLDLTANALDIHLILTPTAAPTETVPEPASVIMLTSGLIYLFYRNRG